MDKSKKVEMLRQASSLSSKVYELRRSVQDQMDQNTDPFFTELLVAMEGMETKMTEIMQVFAKYKI